MTSIKFSGSLRSKRINPEDQTFINLQEKRKYHFVDFAVPAEIKENETMDKYLNLA